MPATNVAGRKPFSCSPLANSNAHAPTTTAASTAVAAVPSEKHRSATAPMMTAVASAVGRSRPLLVRVGSGA
jgi:hypothetical protein